MAKTKTIIISSILIIIAILIILASVRNNPNPTPSQNYCTNESRQGEVCPEVYQPVCGWSNESIQCIKYPCVAMYGNSCEACHDAKVAYYTPGACPA